MRIDHSRLSRRESVLIRAAFAIVFGVFGFVVMVGFLVGVADAMTTDKVPGKPVPSMTTSVCAGIEWGKTDVDGRIMIPFDANQDGMIDCRSDIELGS